NLVESKGKLKRQYDEKAKALNAMVGDSVRKEKQVREGKFDKYHDDRLYKIIGFSEGYNVTKEGSLVDPSGYAHVYTDGSCLRNGKSLVSAVLGVWFGNNYPLNISDRAIGRQTNNSAEIEAAAIAAKQAVRANIRKLTKHSESQFLVKEYTQCLPK
ncbi:ribonuclease H1-like, partial [Belonocnema kinseyi]|uniref:ribonuclease H1-like n=1 Tax=Belonocnema kinseyi TaxID=2817044 RepID=UPI00143D88DB